MKRYVAFAAVFAGFAAPAAAQQVIAPGVAVVDSATLSPDMYRRMAMVSDAFEIQAAQMAMERSRNARVRTFANMMLRDHSMTTQALLGGVQVAAAGMMTMPPLDARHAAMLNQLASAGGAQFDVLYGQMMVVSHQEALALHSGYAQGGSDPALRRFAAQVRPHIRHHLSRARILPGARG